MRFEMRGERIEGLFHPLLVTLGRRLAAEPLDPGRPLPVVIEEAVHIGAGDAAIRRDRSVDAAVGEPEQRTPGSPGPRSRPCAFHIR